MIYAKREDNYSPEGRTQYEHAAGVCVRVVPFARAGWCVCTRSMLLFSGLLDILLDEGLVTEERGNIPILVLRQFGEPHEYFPKVLMPVNTPAGRKCWGVGQVVVWTLQDPQSYLQTPAPAKQLLGLLLTTDFSTSPQARGPGLLFDTSLHLQPR